MRQTTLLLSGILSSVLYVAADIAGSLAWPGYDPFSQAISELTATGAPTRPLLVVPFLAYGALLIAFAVGVMHAARSLALAICGMLLLAVGGIGLAATSFFPMHPRGSTLSIADTMHIVLTALTVFCIAGAMLCAAVALGGRIAGASIAALIVMLGTGALAGVQGDDLAAGLPTPWLGIFERICIGTWLLWVAGLAAALLRSAKGEGARAGRRSRSAPEDATPGRITRRGCAAQQIASSCRTDGG